MLIQSGLPPSFWAEAISTANYVKNRRISRSINGFTPYELWNGRLPVIKHLKTFGEKAFLLNKSPSKGKFEQRGIQDICVGYSSTSKAYRIWVPDWQKIVTTRDVRFTNKLNPVSKYEDIICSQTNNGRFGILDKSSTEASHNETEIGPSVNLDLEHPNNVENDNLIAEPLENVNRDDNVDLK